MEFVNPTNDLAFKKIFGNKHHTNILISFLNAVLEFEWDNRIKTIQFITNEQLPDILELKNTLLDISATNEKWEQFIVEMQVENESAFSKRSLYYTSKSYTSQIKKWANYSQLNKIYFIGILNFIAMDTPAHLTQHLILEKNLRIHYLKDFEFTFIELPKFHKPLDQLHTLIDKWIYFIKHADDLNIIPSQLNDPDFIDAFSIANKCQWNQSELDMYEKISIKQWVDKNVLETATNIGIEKWEKIWIEKWEKKAQLHIAKQLLDILDNQTIAKKTSLSITEIQKLREK